MKTRNYATKANVHKVTVQQADGSLRLRKSTTHKPSNLDKGKGKARSTKRTKRASTKPASKGTLHNPPSSENDYVFQFRDKIQETRFYNLRDNREVLCTKYIDENVLTTLGLLEDVKYMLDNVGWTQFASMQHPTYKTLRLEFLRSLTVEVLRGKKCNKGYIAFRLFNNEHELDLKAFNAIFGWRDEGQRKLALFSENTAWVELTGYGWYATTKRNSHISNPCFKYVHQFMANTIFGRKDSDGVVRVEEAAFLWAMMKKVKLNSGAYFARQLDRVAKQATSGIVIGGLITPIALHLGYDLSRMEAIQGLRKIDMDSCISMGMVERIDEEYHLLFMGSDLGILLPDVERTTVKNKKNWIMKADRDGSSNFNHRAPPPEPSTDFVPVSVNDLEAMASSITSLQAEVKDQRKILERMDKLIQDMYSVIQGGGRMTSTPSDE